MDLTRKRNLFLAITVVLVVAIVAVSAVILVRGPRESSVELVSNNGDGTATVNDINDGNMTIPYYDINVNTYKLQDFKAGSSSTRAATPLWASTSTPRWAPSTGPR